MSNWPDETLWKDIEDGYTPDNRAVFSYLSVLETKLDYIILMMEKEKELNLLKKLEGKYRKNNEVG